MLKKVQSIVTRHIQFCPILLGGDLLTDVTYRPEGFGKNLPELRQPSGPFA